jgi:hypothetical protein
MRDVYRGMSLQVARTTALMIPIFSLLDVARRETSYMQSLGGNFVVTAVVSGGTYFCCAPLVIVVTLSVVVHSSHDSMW